MPHLTIVSGPGEGTLLSIDKPVIVLGSDKTCDILLQLSDPERQKHISRRHAIISRAPDGSCSIEDGNGKGKPSKNHTYVNDTQVPFPGRTPLADNDVIQIFDFVFIFSEDSSIQATVAHDSGSVFAQTAEKLKLILEFGKSLSTTLELDALLPQVVDSLLKHFKYADRALLIEVDAATGAHVVVINRTRNPEQASMNCFSDTIVDQCLSSVKGMLINEPRIQLPGSDSVVSLETAMCAPLWSQDGKAFGVLLLDSQAPKRKFNDDDLNFLMGVASQASIALANARYHKDALEQERIKRDLDLAAKVVLSFLPDQVPNIPGYEFYARSEPALEVGGDYYDFQHLKDGRLAILVGDVTGKGVAAALVMSRFSAEVRACLRTEPNLVAAIAQLDELMQPLNLTDRFVTLAALVLDPVAHTVTIVNAGHPPPLLLRAATGKLEEAAPRDSIGPPIAVLEHYPFESHQITLEPGDNLVLFSDGVTEAMDVHGHDLTVAGLCRIAEQCKGSAKKLGACITQGVRDHAAGCPQHDDITLVCFGRLA